MNLAGEISEVLGALSQARSGYLKAAAAQPGEEALSRQQLGEWSASQVGAHMAEWSEFILACLRRIEAELDPLIGRVLDDPARLSGVDRRGHLPLQETSVIVASTWDAIFALVKGWSEQTWFRRYRHLHYETDSAVAFLRRAVGHFDGHTKQLERIRAAAGTNRGKAGLDRVGYPT